MREHCDWPPTTIPAAQEQRRERVEQARRRIVYRPEPYTPYEAAPEPTSPFSFSISGPAWTRLLWYLVPFALLAAALAWVIRATESDIRMVRRGVTQNFMHQLPGAPTFLTEDLALGMAKQDLALMVSDPSAWHPWQSYDKKVRTAPDRTPDTYLFRLKPNTNAGMLMFTNGQRPDQLFIVTVELQGSRVQCSISRSR